MCIVCCRSFACLGFFAMNIDTVFLSTILMFHSSSGLATSAKEKVDKYWNISVYF